MTSASLALWGLAQAVPGLGTVRLAGPAPSPAPGQVVRTPEPGLVTPGTVGFLVTFGVAVALVLLVRDMVRRNRGLVVRAERRDAELRAAELREAQAQEGATRPDLPSTAGERPGPERQGPAAPNG